MIFGVTFSVIVDYSGFKSADNYLAFFASKYFWIIGVSIILTWRYYQRIKASEKFIEDRKQMLEE